MKDTNRTNTEAAQIKNGTGHKLAKREISAGIFRLISGVFLVICGLLFMGAMINEFNRGNETNGLELSSKDLRELASLAQHSTNAQTNIPMLTETTQSHSSTHAMGTKTFLKEFGRPLGFLTLLVLFGVAVFVEGVTQLTKADESNRGKP